MVDDEPLNAVQVAALLHVGRNKVYEMAQSGELSSYRIGRKLLFAPEDVQRFLGAHRNGSAEGEGAGPGGKPARPQVSGDPQVQKPPSQEYLEGLVQPEPGFVLAGEGVVASLTADALEAAGCRTARLQVNGYAALVGMYLGEVDAACVSLYDAKTNSCNAAFVQRLVPGVSVASLCLVECKRGFAVAAGNPKKITTWGGLLKEGVRLAQQERGSAARVLLDGKLMMLEARSENIAGYGGVATDGPTAVRKVAAGISDVAVCTEQEAGETPGVDFVALQAERVDLVVRKSAETRDFLKKAKQAVADERFRSLLASATGADCRRTGSVVYES